MSCCNNGVYLAPLEIGGEILVFVKQPTLYNGFPYWVSDQPGGAVLYMFRELDAWYVSENLGDTDNYLLFGKDEDGCPESVSWSAVSGPYNDLIFQACAPVGCEKYRIEYGRGEGVGPENWGIDGYFQIAEFSGYFNGAAYYSLFNAFGPGLTLYAWYDGSNDWYITDNIGDLTNTLATIESNSDLLPVGSWTVINSPWVTFYYGNFSWPTFESLAGCATDCPCITLEFLYENEITTLQLTAAGTYSDGINPTEYNYYTFTAFDVPLFLWFSAEYGSWFISLTLGNTENAVAGGGATLNSCPEGYFGQAEG